jgi:hypothetical protein
MLDEIRVRMDEGTDPQIRLILKYATGCAIQRQLTITLARLGLPKFASSIHTSTKPPQIAHIAHPAAASIRDRTFAKRRESKTRQSLDVKNFERHPPQTDPSQAQDIYLVYRGRPGGTPWLANESGPVGIYFKGHWFCNVKEMVH